MEKLLTIGLVRFLSELSDWLHVNKRKVPTLFPYFMDQAHNMVASMMDENEKLKDDLAKARLTDSDIWHRRCKQALTYLSNTYLSDIIFYEAVRIHQIDIDGKFTVNAGNDGGGPVYTDEQEKLIKEFTYWILAGNLLSAIRAYRSLTGLGMTDSKKVIEKLSAKIHTEANSPPSLPGVTA